MNMLLIDVAINFRSIYRDSFSEQCLINAAIYRKGCELIHQKYTTAEKSSRQLNA